MGPTAIPAGPSGVLAAATAGLRRAGAQAADAAERVARFGAAAPGAMPTAPPIEGADPGRAMVDLLVARRAYEANARVVTVADEMAAELLSTRRAGGEPAGGR
jgi:flagellar hook protein FlgE